MSEFPSKTSPISIVIPTEATNISPVENVPIPKTVEISVGHDLPEICIAEVPEDPKPKRLGTPSANYPANDSQFGVVKEFSVVSKRLVGQSMQNRLSSGNVQNLLIKSKSDARINTIAVENSLGATPRDSPIRKSSTSGLGFGEGGYGDRSTSNWDWPFPTKPVVTSTDDFFQAEIDYTPFQANEIWAKVMGTELIIQCIPKDEDDPSCKIRFAGQPRHIFRTYQLPLNTDPRSVKFRMLEKRNKLRIFAQKLPPMKLAVAAYVPLEDIGKADENQLAVKVYEKLRQLRQPGPVLNLDTDRDETV